MENNEILLLPEQIHESCYSCNDDVRGDTKNRHDGELYCSDCFEEKFSKCARCHDIQFNNDLEEVDSIGLYCSSCISDYTFYCEYCEARYSDSQVYSYEGGNYGTICQNCRDEHFTSCTACDYLAATDDTYYCESCENDYCSSCWESEHNCEEGQERRVTTEPLMGEKKGKYIKINRLVGCEIEAEKGTREALIDRLHAQCGITDDGSLVSGTEVQTPPSSLDTLEELIKKTTKTMIDANFEVSTRCGLHVHIDARDFRQNYSKIAKLFRVMYAVEPLIYALLPESRRTGDYSVPLKRHFDFGNINSRMTEKQVKERWYVNKEGSYLGSSDNKYNHTRYHGLNLHSIFYRGTVEFRYHSGTLNSDKILNWIDLLLHFVDYSLNHYNSVKVYQLFKTKDNTLKFNQAVEMFKLSKRLQKYMKERIEKNNPTFFNKKKRINMRKKLEDYRNELMEKHNITMQSSIGIDTAVVYYQNGSDVTDTITRMITQYANTLRNSEF